MVMDSDIKSRGTGLFLAALGLYMGLSLFSYDAWDMSFFTYTTRDTSNLGGSPGAYLADLLLTGFGLSSFAIAGFLLITGLKRALRMGGHRVHFLGAGLFIASSSLLLSMMKVSFDLKYGAGGVFGSLVGGALTGLITLPGAYVVSIALLMSSLILLSPILLIN